MYEKNALLDQPRQPQPLSRENGRKIAYHGLEKLSPTPHLKNHLKKHGAEPKLK